MGLVTGISTSKFTATKEARAQIVSLPLANSSGLIETITPRKIQHELIGLDINNPSIQISQSIMGYFLSWTYHYNEFITGETLMLMQSIFRYSMEGWNLKLTPRIDQPNRFFEVIWDAEAFDLGIRKKSGGTVKYHRLPVFRFTTKYMETDLKWELLTTTEVTYGGTTQGSPLEGQRET